MRRNRFWCSNVWGLRLGKNKNRNILFTDIWSNGDFVVLTIFHAKMLWRSNRVTTQKKTENIFLKLSCFATPNMDFPYFIHGRCDIMSVICWYHYIAVSIFHTQQRKMGRERALNFDRLFFILFLFFLLQILRCVACWFGSTSILFRLRFFVSIFGFGIRSGVLWPTAIIILFDSRLMRDKRRLPSSFNSFDGSTLSTNSDGFCFIVRNVVHTTGNWMFVCYTTISLSTITSSKISSVTASRSNLFFRTTTRMMRRLHGSLFLSLISGCCYHLALSSIELIWSDSGVCIEVGEAFNFHCAAVRRLYYLPTLMASLTDREEERRILLSFAVFRPNFFLVFTIRAAIKLLWGESAWREVKGAETFKEQLDGETTKGHRVCVCVCV